MAPRNETELLNATIDLARLQRWAVCHFRPALTRAGWRTAIQGHIGYPDLTLARGGVVLMRELKGPGGRLTPEQLDWARQISGDPHWQEMPRGITRALRATRALDLFDVWRPSDWESIIVPTLTARKAA